MIRQALFIALAAGLSGLAGCGRGFGIEVDVQQGCLADPVGGTITVQLQPSGQMTTTAIADPAGFFAGNPKVVIVPPDGATQITVTVIGRDRDGGSATGTATISIAGHHELSVSLTLGECMPGNFDMATAGDLHGDSSATSNDLAGADSSAGVGDLAVDSSAGVVDLAVDSSAVVGDLAVADLAVADLAVADLAVARPDLAGSDLTATPADLAVPDLTQLDTARPTDLATIDLSSPDLAPPPCTDQACALLPATPFCDRLTGRCVACAMDSQCGPGTVCDYNLHSCVAGCNQGHGCSDGGACNVDAGQCQCANDSSCGGMAPRCDVATGSCVACLPGGPECNGTCLKVNGVYTCLANCQSNNDCAAPATGCCGGHCVNENGDIDNCGACGVVCPAIPNATPGCNGQCIVKSCAFGYFDCNGTVADGCEVNIQSDPMNCSFCGKVCPKDAPQCTAGICGGGQCALNQAMCNGVCKDVLSDVNNCGSCGYVCQTFPNATAYCSMGKCSFTCTPPYASCLGFAPCTQDTDTDPENCGGCRIACAQGQACVGGKCM